jgi:hypothetical protein
MKFRRLVAFPLIAQSFDLYRFAIVRSGSGKAAGPNGGYQEGHIGALHFLHGCIGAQD